MKKWFTKLFNLNKTEVLSEEDEHEESAPSIEDTITMGGRLTVMDVVDIKITEQKIFSNNQESLFCKEGWRGTLKIERDDTSNTKRNVIHVENIMENNFKDVLKQLSIEDDLYVNLSTIAYDRETNKVIQDIIFSVKAKELLSINHNSLMLTYGKGSPTSLKTIKREDE